MNPQNLIEQNIKIQKAVTNGATVEFSIDIPTDQDVYLRGYGYQWFANCVFQLVVGEHVFPVRNDQEGSIAQPQLWAKPWYASRGSKVKLVVINNSGADITIDSVFFLLTSSFLPVTSTGGAILISTSSSSGSGNNIALYDSTFANAAPVDATRGVSVKPTAPSALLCDTIVTTGATKIALAASTSCEWITLQADIANADDVLVGNTTNQLIRLSAGQSIDIKTNNLANVFIKRPNATNVTVNYVGG